MESKIGRAYSPIGNRLDLYADIDFVSNTMLSAILPTNNYGVGMSLMYK
jgi:hypothetical protein